MALAAALARGRRTMPRRRRVAWRREVASDVGGIAALDGREVLPEGGRDRVAPGGRVAIVYISS